MANGIKLGGQEIYADFLTNGIRFTFREGGRQSLATFRGEDDVIPEAAGRTAGVYIADTREVKLHGIIQGAGATAAAIRESFATRMALVLAVMDPATPITIVAYPPHFGLATATTATLTSVRPLRIVGPDPAELAWYEVWEGDLHLECIASPPNWTVA